jgi:serine/threonine protein kinase/tetratricopeptide (TPR) repeat protein
VTERSIFLAALEIDDPRERAAYLDTACNGNADLRRGVEALLAADGRSGSFMSGPAAGEPTAVHTPAEGPGSRVGPYKLLQQIGEGGMGVVYMAEQAEPVRRTVALKIIKPGMDSKQVVARFEAERQALSMMDHPNIARVLDAGTTGSGRPYFVMELVHGVPITKFCDDNKLTPRERLGLFVPVCQAIQHAHQKGIIHRDVKPSNVLVTMYDDKPVPKVIDFGVAKAVEQRLTEKTLFTQYGALVGTFEYMSPEQAEMNAFGVDTRSDVYSLGVLLYELLTGTTPLERRRLREAALGEVIRLIKEEEPPRPSTRLSTTGTLDKVAAARKTDPAKLSALVRGELDWIVMKCLEKDRARRYETANGLARDVERFLGGDAVEACPPTVGYRFRKAYRRNRAAVLVAGAFLGLLAASTAVAIILAVQARTAEREATAERNRAAVGEAEANEQRELARSAQLRAEEEKQAAEAVRNFLQDDLLRQADVYRQAEAMPLAGGEFAIKENPSIIELLDRAAAQLTPERIEKKFPGMPFVQAEVLHAVGNAYVGVSQHEKAQPLIDRAVKLYEASRGPDAAATLLARQSLAYSYYGISRIDPRAEPLLKSFIADGTRVLGPKDRRVFDARITLGAFWISTNRTKEAIPYFRQLREEGRDYYGATDPLAVLAWGHVAVAYRVDKQFALALKEIESIRDAMKGVAVRPDHPAVEAGLVELASTYQAQGEMRKAIEVYQEVLDGWKQRGEPFHWHTWRPRHLVAWIYARNGEPAKAAELFEANVAAASSPYQAFLSLNAAGRAEEKLGRDDRTLVARARQALAAAIGSNGPQYRNWVTGWARVQLGRYLVRVKEYEEAETLLTVGLREMIDEYNQVRDYALVAISDGQQSLRELYQRTNRTVEGARVMAEIWAAMDKQGGRARAGAYGARHTLAWSIIGQDPAVAAMLFEQNVRAASNPTDKANALHGLHEAELNQGKMDAALKHSKEALDTLVSSGDAKVNGFTVGKKRVLVGNVLFRMEKYAEAESYLEQGCREIAAHLELVPAFEYPYISGPFEQLAQVYQTTNRTEQAREWLAFKRDTFDRLVRRNLVGGKLTLNAVKLLRTVILDHVDAGRADEAFALYRETSDRHTPVDRETANAWLQVSGVVFNSYEGRLQFERMKPWAELRIPTLERELKAVRAAKPSELRLLQATNSLAFSYLYAGRKADVVKLAEEALARNKANGWKDAAGAVAALGSLSKAVALAGRADLATEISTAVLAALKQQTKPRPDAVAAATFSLGFARSHAGAHMEAEGHFRDALRLQAGADAKHWTAAKYKAWLGFALHDRKQYAAAEPVLLEAHAELAKAQAALPLWERQHPLLVAERLASLYAATDRPDEAAEWRGRRGKK